jgi:EAL domain-containing protein (putative c-di-GMP-specific phosphodiesterase class I)
LISNNPISTSELINLIDHNLFGVEYQPLINVTTGEIYAYEALARFYTLGNRKISPLLVFSALHDNPITLFKVECQLKKLQIAHAPQEKKLFLNLDPDAYVAHGSSGLDNPLLNLLCITPEIVVELIENTDSNDARICIELSKVLSNQGVSIAIDDIGSPHSMLSIPIMTMVNYMKLDKYWLRFRDDKNHYALLNKLVQYAQETGKITVLEGIETESDYYFAQQLGIDLVQGYLFKEQFVEYIPRPLKSICTKIPVYL